MNTVTKTEKPAALTRKMRVVEFLAQSVARMWHFYEHDSDRYTSISLALDSWMNNNAPRGSGIDSGTQLDLDKFCPKVGKLVFTTAFHHMSEHGMYDGWTHHAVVVTPSFIAPGIDIVVKGRDRNGIKDYLGEQFHHWLTMEQDVPALVEHEYL